jgi:hypothetical protein
MEFSQLLDEALVFGCSVNIIIVIYLGGAPAQEMLHCGVTRGTCDDNREIGLLILVISCRRRCLRNLQNGPRDSASKFLSAFPQRPGIISTLILRPLIRACRMTTGTPNRLQPASKKATSRLIGETFTCGPYPTSLFTRRTDHSNQSRTQVCSPKFFDVRC